MITGFVNPDLEAMIRLHIVDQHGQTQAIDLKIDTGFTGFLSLPTAVVNALGLQARTRENVQIADGSIVRASICAGAVIWDGKSRSVEVHSMGAEATIGMALLAGHDLAIRVKDGGAVTIAFVS